MNIKSIKILSEEEPGGTVPQRQRPQKEMYCIPVLTWINRKKRIVSDFLYMIIMRMRKSRDVEEGFGFPLQRYLDVAGATDVNEIRLGSVDGFESVVTELGSRRYFFPGLLERSAEGKEPREAFISFCKNGIPVKYYPHPDHYVRAAGN